MVMVSVRAIMSHGYGMVAPEVAEVGSVFLRLRVSMSTKECARLWRELGFDQNVLLAAGVALSKDEGGKMCKRL